METMPSKDYKDLYSNLKKLDKSFREIDGTNRKYSKMSKKIFVNEAVEVEEIDASTATKLLDFYKSFSQSIANGESAIQACLQKLDILISARQAPEIQVESPIPAIEISQEKLLTKRKEPPTTPKQPQPKRVKRGIREKLVESSTIAVDPEVTKKPAPASGTSNRLSASSNEVKNTSSNVQKSPITSSSVIEPLIISKQKLEMIEKKEKTKKHKAESLKLEKEQKQQKLPVPELVPLTPKQQKMEKEKIKASLETPKKTEVVTKQKTKLKSSQGKLKSSGSSTPSGEKKPTTKLKSTTPKTEKTKNKKVELKIPVGHQVCALVRPDEWILAKISKHLTNKGCYEVEDIDEEDGNKKYILPPPSVIPLPTLESNHPNGFQIQYEFQKDDPVYAIFPNTTCFYRANVVAVPNRRRKVAEFLLKFEDDEDEEGNTPQRTVIPLYVVPRA